MAAAATIATLAVPALYEQSILFRFAVILLAGLFGVPGLACGALLILAMACGSDPFGYDYLYPLMPPGKAALRDGFVRAIWSRLAQKGRCCRAMQKSNVDFYPVLLLSILADTLLRLHTGYWARAGLLALPASAAVLAAVLLLVSTSWQETPCCKKFSVFCWQSVQHWKFCACTPCLAACTPVHWGWRAPVLSCWHRSSTSGGPALRQTANALLVFGAACMAIMVLSVAPRLRVPNLHAAPLTGQDWQAAFVSQLALPPEYLLFALWPPQPGQRCRKAATFAASALGFDAAVHLLLELFLARPCPPAKPRCRGCTVRGAFNF